jgi:hypothetical protein
MDRRRRVLFASIVLLGTVECLWLVFVGVVEWDLRNLWLKPGDPQMAINARTAIADLTFMALNVIALVAFIRRRRGLAVGLMVGVQLFDVVNMLYAGLESAAGGFWDTAAFRWVIAVVPATIAVLVLWHLRLDVNERASQPLNRPVSNKDLGA